MSQIEVELVVTFEVPETGLNVNGFFRSMIEAKEKMGRSATCAMLEAIEERKIEEMQKAHPERWIRNGHESKARTFRGSIGEVRHRMAQLYDRKTEKTILPLREALSITDRRRIVEEATEAGVGQVVHVSYRRSATEVERIRGDGRISASTLHRRLAEFSDQYCRLGDYTDVAYRFFMVDGTGCLIQGPGGSKAPDGEIRWVLASRGEGKPFEAVGVYVNTSWKDIKVDLKSRLNYDKLEVLLSDGEQGCEVFLEEGMRHQRCEIHGKRDLPYILYKDGFKKAQQEPFLEKMDSLPVFHVSREGLEKLRPQDRDKVEEKVKLTKHGFDELLDILDPDTYPRAHTYVKNLADNVITFFSWWLDKGEWIPFSTNAVESAISRIKNRVRRVGRRWSEHGLLRFLQTAIAKIFRPETWDDLWRQYLAVTPGLRLISLKVAYRWL